MTDSDPYLKIVMSSDIADKPDGIKILDWIVDKHERKSGSKRTVNAAVASKIRAHELAQEAKAAKLSAKAITAAVIAPRVTPTPARPASLHAQYRQLQATNPRAAGKFWQENKLAIMTQKSI